MMNVATVMTKLDSLLAFSTPLKKRRLYSTAGTPNNENDVSTEICEQDIALGAVSTQDIALETAFTPPVKVGGLLVVDVFDCSMGLAGVTLWGVIEASVQKHRFHTKDKNVKGRIERTIQFIKEHLGEQYNLLREYSRAPEDRASREWSDWAKRFKDAVMKLQRDVIDKLNAFEREAKEKETKSIKVSTFAQSIGKANVKLKANEAI